MSKVIAYRGAKHVKERSIWPHLLLGTVWSAFELQLNQTWSASQPACAVAGVVHGAADAAERRLSSAVTCLAGLAVLAAGHESQGRTYWLKLCDRLWWGLVR
jgi:hypothetical protein